MKIAVTGAAGYIGSQLVPYLKSTHEVFASDILPDKGATACAVVDVLDSDSTDSFCAGMDAVVHLASFQKLKTLSQHENSARMLDTRLKGTYNVLNSAMKAGVKRVIQVSDLCIFHGYERDIIVSEDFAPLPDTSPYGQSVYLSELIGREFARLSPGLVLTLRLGIVITEGTMSADVDFEDSWLSMDDALPAVARALSIEQYDWMGHWGLYNLAADVPGSRYSLGKIKSGQFDFRPLVSFGTWREGGIS
jgi:nucleoside-diphosphate-sugar epimerase